MKLSKYIHPLPGIQIQVSQDVARTIQTVQTAQGDLYQKLTFTGEALFNTRSYVRVLLRRQCNLGQPRVSIVKHL